MSILSLAIQQKKKQNNAGGSSGSSSRASGVPSLLGATIQAKKAGVKLPSTIGISSFRSPSQLNPASYATLKSVMNQTTPSDATNGSLRPTGLQNITSSSTTSAPVGLDDNSLAYQMLKDRAAGERNQSTFGTPAQDAYNQESALQKYWLLTAAPENPAAAALYFMTNGFKPNRASNVVKGNVKEYIGSIVSAIGALAQAVANTPAQQYEPKTSLDQWTSAVSGMHDNPVVFAMNQIRSNKESAEAVMELGQDARDYGSKIAEEGQRLIQEQKKSLGKVGQTLVDVGSVGTQMAMDIGIGWLTGLGMAAPMAVRVFGSSAEKSAKEGANLNQQLAYSFGTAAVAYGLEHLSNVAMAGLKVVAPGVSDDFAMAVIDKLAVKLAKTPAGAAALKTIGTLFASGAGEGFEEILEDFAQPYLQKMTYDPNAKSLFEDPSQLSEYLYDGFLGFIMGLTGASVNASVNTGANTGADGDIKAAYEEYRGIFTDQVVNDAYESLKRNGMFSPQGRHSLASANKMLDGYEPSWQKTDGVKQAMPGVTDNVTDSMDPAGSQRVSEVGSDLGRGKASSVPTAPQADTQGIDINTATQETVPQLTQTQKKEDPLSVPATAETVQQGVFSPNLRADVSKTQVVAPSQQIQQNAAQTQRTVSNLDTAAKDPGFYSNDRFRGTEEDAAYLDRLAKAAGISIEMAEAKNSSNGWIVNGKAYISEETSDPLRVVAKHEVTHHLQDAAGESYTQFRDYVEQIYRGRGTLDQQISAIQTLYRRNGQELSREAALDELAADYAGELLENESLIRKLAGENRSLGQKILDAIRNLLSRVRTAFGSAEVKQLDRAARLWEAALSEANKSYSDGSATLNTSTRYSIKETVDGRAVAVVDDDILSHIDTTSWDGEKKTQAKTAAKTALLAFKDGIAVNGVTYKVNKVSRDEYTRSNYTEMLYNRERDVFADKMRAAANADDIVIATTSWDLDGELKHPRTDNFVDFARGEVLIQAGTNQYDAETVVGITKEGEYVLYDLVDMEPTRFEIKEEPSTAAASTEAGSAIQEDSSDDSIPENADSVNGEERLSVKGSRDLQKQIDALERQNKRLKEQMKRTDIPKVRRDVVKRSAKDLRSMFSSKIDLDVLTDRIEGVYNQLSTLSGAGNLQELDGIPTWDGIKTEMRSIADAILAESRANVNPLAEEYGEIRKELRGRKISIADEYRADLESAGGYEGIRKRNFGTFSLSKDGAPIDTVYDELNEKYPTLFPDDIVHPADQLIRLSDVMEELKAVEGNPFEQDLDSTARYLAGEIEERFYDTPNQKPTLADKMANTYHRQRVKDQKDLRARLEDQRRAYEQQVDSIHNQYARENRTRIENQNAAQRRETIYRHANRLGKMLARPTNKRHIPEELRGAAVHMLNLINTGSNYQVAYGQDAMYHRVAPGEVLGAEDTSRTAAARALKAVYEDILKEGGLSVDPDITDYLEKLAKLGNKPLGDMTRAELDTVWRVLQVVEHSITRANELHGEGRYRTVEGMANALRDGIGTRKDRTNWAGPAGMVDQLLNRDMIAPETFFHVLGDVGEGIFKQMRRSADRQTRILKEGSDRAAELIKESGVVFKKADKEHHTFHLKGGDLTLSTSQLMELYALNKRKQAMEHIYVGGLKSVGGVKGFKETGRSKPVKVTPEDVGTMLDTLTDKQKALMDGLQAYLSGDLAKHGNEESMKVYGYEKFKEKNYWPIKVSTTETKSDPTSEARSKTIPGYGMTKELTPMASNSVELRSAIDTFSSHLNQMATYAAWLGTNEDVTRFHNFKYTDDNMGTDGTVKELFERVYGKKGSEYLENLLSDIAQGTKTGADRTPLEGMFGRWKAAKVGGNLRVIIQQPTAILRAMSMVNPRFLATAKSPKAGWKKALEYSEIAQWKDWGYFEMDTGRSVRELITGTENGLDKTKNFFMWGAGAADSLSWGHLWNAIEAETVSKHKDLAKGSKEFYESVADRFAEVVDRTQVVDSVLHRTQIMRSSSYAAKLSTSFMSEPSKIYNMVVRDLYDLKSAPSIDARKKAGKQLARTTSSLIVSFAINAAAQALIDGLRDDDRDNKYKWKFKKAFPENFGSNFNPLSYLPYLKDISSIIEGFTMERSDLEGVSDLINAAAQLGKAMHGDSGKTVLNAGLNAACRLGDLLGLPISNLKREAESIFNTVLIECGLQELRYQTDKLLYNPEKSKGIFYNDLYRAMDSDPGVYQYIWDDLLAMSIENMETEDIEKAMESRMKQVLELSSVANLPIRFSAPGKDPDFDALMRQAAESGKEWFELLPPGSVELAQELDALGTDAKKLQRVVEIGEADYDDDVKCAALKLTLTEAEFKQFESARKAGIKIRLWTEIYKAVSDAKVARTGKTGEPSQDDVEKALNRFRLTTAQWRAIWKSYGWKSDSPR